MIYFITYIFALNIDKNHYLENPGKFWTAGVLKKII